MSKLVVYKASAGSGKTFRLAAEYIKMVATNPLAYRKILAVTFTNKATAEMKERILLELFKLSNGTESAMQDLLVNETGLSLNTLRQNAKEALSNILHDYSMFSVSTIDSFVQRVIQNLLWEIGFHGNSELRLEYGLIVERAVDRLLDSSANNVELFDRFQRLMYEQMEEDKSPDIRKMLIKLGLQLYSEQFRLLGKEQMELMASKELIDAVAGYSGAKIEEIAGGINSRGLMLIDEIADNGFNPDDFSYGMSGVYGSIVKASRFRAYDEIFEIGKRTLSALEVVSGDSWITRDFERKNPTRAGQLKGLIESRFHDQLFGIVQFIEDNQSEYYTALSVSKNLDTLIVFNDIREKIREILVEENAMILADSGPLLREFIKGNDAPFVYEKIGTRYDCYMLDEFQDTSVIQWHNFKPLIGSSLSQDEFSMVVGDVKQAIYRWRNSDWRILANQINGDFAVDVRNLLKNHRSRFQIVQFNNSFFSRASELLVDWTKNICGSNVSEELLSLAAKAYENPAQECALGNSSDGFVEFTHFTSNDSNVEDELLYQKFEKLVPDLVRRGYRTGDIAILVRKKEEGKRIASILLSLKNKHPEQAQLFNVVSQDALRLNASHAVQLCIAAMRLILNSADSLAAGILSKEIMVLGEQPIDWEFTFLRFSIDAEKQWLASLTNLPLVAAFESILKRYNLQNLSRELPYLALLQEQIMEITKTGAIALSYFLEWWDSKGSGLTLSMPESGDAINIMTIHKSKGLQFPIVIVPYASIDMFRQDTWKLLWLSTAKSPYSKYPLYPISYEKYLSKSEFKADYLEEKVQTMVDNLNLLYVAFTRPESELYAFTSSLKVNDETRTTADIILPILAQMDANINDFDDKELSVHIREYSFGKSAGLVAPKSLKNEGEATVWMLNSYSVSDELPRVARQLEAVEFFRDSPSPVVAGIEHGKLMHRLFSLIGTATDVDNALQTLQAEGLIPASQAGTLHGYIMQLLGAQPFSDWFSGRWAVRNECEILTGNSAIFRPDRVMMLDGQAIVLDYKFGEQLPAHRVQVKNYIQLIKNMGYSGVQGYLWYVDSGILLNACG